MRILKRAPVKEPKPSAEKKKRVQREENSQTAIATWMKYQHPNVVFTMEASGLRVGFKAAIMMKAQRSDRGLPDMIILEPRGGFHGLLLEIKDRRTLQGPIAKTPRGRMAQAERKNSELLERFFNTVHGKEQKEMIERFRELGFCAEFVVGSDEGIKTIERYMKLSRSV